MNERGEKLMASVMADLSANVTKSAGGTAWLPRRLVEGVIGPLCEMVGLYAENVEEVTKVLHAIADPLPGEQFLAPYRPDQWHTRLMPNLPPRPKNGANSE